MAGTKGVPAAANGLAPSATATLANAGAKRPNYACVWFYSPYRESVLENRFQAGLSIFRLDKILVFQRILETSFEGVYDSRLPGQGAREEWGQPRDVKNAPRGAAPSNCARDRPGVSGAWAAPVDSS